MYAENDIARLLAAAENFNLQIPAGILDQSPDKLCKICNGVGCEHPEHISPALRKALNRVYAFAECSVMLHDWEYFNSDGAEISREKADKQFRANMLDEIEGRNPRFKWLKQWLALRAYEAVRKYGRADWCIAFAENGRGK